MAEVLFDKVSKTYAGGIRGVSELDLEVRDGEFLVLVGPSGCGKSTTLRLIAGLETASSGTIRIGNRVANDLPPRDRNAALVFQNGALYPHLNVYQNLAHSLRLHCEDRWYSRVRRLIRRPRMMEQERTVSQSEIDVRVREAARSLGIDGLLERMPGELSGGEQQRVALGRAVVRRPDLFLFDEPLSNLDSHLRGELRREIRAQHDRRPVTTVYVTHDQAEAMSLADRLGVMHEGRIQQLGSPKEIFDNPINTFTARFIGAEPMNLILGRFRGSDERIRFLFDGGETDVPFPFPERGDNFHRSVYLGIRAENVHPSLEESSPSDICRGEVISKELTGESILVRVRCLSRDGRDSRGFGREETVVCRVDSRAGDGYCVGRPVSVRFDSTRACWFDGETGVNLSAGKCQTS